DRMQDVTLLAVGIMQQRQPRRAVRIVFDGRDVRWHALFLAAKIHHAILFLVPAAAMPDGQLALGLPAAAALFGFGQGLLRLLLRRLALIEHGDEAARRRIRVKTL